MAAGSPGAPARNREGGSGGRRCQTARDNNKHTAVAPQPPVERVDQGKSGPGENGGRWSEAAMRQENHRWSEVAAHEKRSRLTGAAWKAVAAVAPPRADSPEDQREVAGGRKRQQALVVVARLPADSPEDQLEAAGGRTPEERPAKGTVCEVAESPAWLREDSPEDQREAPGGQNLQRRRT